MRQIRDLIFRLRALTNRRAMERELDEEMAFHLDMATQRHLGDGLSHREARRRAEDEFGVPSRARQQARDAWGLVSLDEILGDSRHALRQMRKRPGFALLATLTLALGIGGTVAFFSIVNGLLLRPLPYPDADALQVFWSDGDWMAIEVDTVRERIETSAGSASSELVASGELAASGELTALDGLSAFARESMVLRQEDGATLVSVTAASGELFEVLGVGAALGRTFAPTDDIPGAEPVVVLSYALWQQELGGDPDVLGRRLALDGVATTVIGVMPEGFFFPFPEQRAWRPLGLAPGVDQYADNGFLSVLARVAANIDEAQLEGEIQAIAAHLGETFDYPEAWDKSRGAHSRPLTELVFGEARTPLVLLLGAMALVFLIACANVAALLLVRTADRSGELAMRAALGAGRARLRRQLITEILVLALVAGAAGAALAMASFDLLLASLPLPHGLAEHLALDWTSFAAALALATGAGLLVAQLPVRRLRQGPGVARASRSDGARAGQHGRAQGIFVAAEVLLAVTLVSGAALLMRSVDKLLDVDLGLEPSGAVALDLVAAPGEMDVDARRVAYAEAVRRAATLPGVEAVGLVNRLPLRDGGWQGPVTVEGWAGSGEGLPNSYWRTATSATFAALGLDIVNGRAFGSQDRAESLPVAVVSQTFASAAWPGRDAIGQRFKTGNERGTAWITVVGVVEDVRVRSLRGENPPVLWRPQEQRPGPGARNTLILRGGEHTTSLALVTAARELPRAIDPRLAVARLTTLDDVVGGSISAHLRLRFFLLLFGVLGATLGAVGVYGAVATWVARRRGELGVRLALGASPARLRRDVIIQALAPVAVGAAAGVLVAAITGRALQGFLYGVLPGDPVSLATAAGILLLAGLGAAAWPAWSASRTDPSSALRAD